MSPVCQITVWRTSSRHAPPNSYPPTAGSFGGLGPGFGTAQDKSCTFNGQPTSCTELRHQIDIDNAALEIQVGIHTFEVPITSAGLGMFTIETHRFVRDPGEKLGPAGPDDPDEAVVRVNIDQEGKGHYERFLLSVESNELPSTPQSSVQKTEPCKGPIPEAAGRAILTAANEAGIDPTLLSVTWRHESGFTEDPFPNPRKERGKIVGYDVGPLQLSTNYFDKSPYTKGLPKAFTGHSFTFSNFFPHKDARLSYFNEGVRFNGVTSQNLLAGARAFALAILPNSRSLADAAGLYRAGSRSGPYQSRFDQYTNEAAADKAYLDCLKNH